MRPGNHSKWQPRPRRAKPHHAPSRSLDSNGPDVKIRGTASHIARKYQHLAREAQMGGDRVKAENYLQHAEHYQRLASDNETRPTQPQRKAPPRRRDQQQWGAPDDQPGFHAPPHDSAPPDGDFYGNNGSAPRGDNLADILPPATPSNHRDED